VSSRDVVEVLDAWPKPESGAPEPRIRATEGCLVVGYGTADGKYAVIEFPVCHQFTFGHPNDEALQGHPLYQRGLKFYSVHRIKNSSRLAALERANAVHPQHDSVAYLQDKEHYVFTFHDSTLECLVTAGDRGRPKSSVYSTAEEANTALGNRVA
jgi:hypothetical protein